MDPRLAVTAPKIEFSTPVAERPKQVLDPHFWTATRPGGGSPMGGKNLVSSGSKGAAASAMGAGAAAVAKNQADEGKGGC